VSLSCLTIVPPNEDDRRPVIFPLAKKVNCAAELTRVPET
jgi:hypothetical protein